MKAKLKAAGAALLSAVTSPTAVKAEKSVLVLVVTLVALAIGASAGLADLIGKIVGAL